MPDAEPSTHVDDGELILRRIPINPGWYNPASGEISHLAFRPRRDDVTGLSVTRAKSDSHPEFLTPAQDAALGTNASGYYVAVLRVGDLRSHDINVVAKSEQRNSGHAELALLAYDARRSLIAIDATSLLAEKLTIRVEGPFAPTTSR